MTNAKFINGTPQSLYWPDGHKCASVFKGMTAILEELGFTNMMKFKAQCKDFKSEGYDTLLLLSHFIYSTRFC